VGPSWQVNTCETNETISPLKERALYVEQDRCLTGIDEGVMRGKTDTSYDVDLHRRNVYNPGRSQKQARRPRPVSVFG
jgi:hypothetical protein